MAKYDLPTQEFDREIPQGSVEKAAKAAGAKTITQASGKVFDVPRENIRLIEGYNVRVESPEYLKHIASLANSIRENGYDPTRPLSGYAGQDEGEHIIYLTDGHSRLRAVDQLAAEGVTVETLPVIIMPQTTTSEDLQFALITANEGKPLSAYEKAVVIKRLIGQRVSKEDIARRIGVTARMVDNYLLLAASPAAIRDILIEGRVAATLVLKVLKEHKKPAEALKALKAAIKLVDEITNGKGGKVTEKHVKAAAEQSSSSDSPITITNDVVKGKAVQRRTYKLESNTSVLFSDIKEIRSLGGGKWWSREEGEDEVLILEDIKISVVIEKPALDEQQPVGEPDEGEPEADEPDEGEPEADEPEADEPEADEPEADEPEADEPDEGEEDEAPADDTGL